MFQFVTKDNVRRGTINSFTKKFYGHYKADFIGEFFEGDYGYFKILFQGYELPARPVYGVGSRVMLPTKNWLSKFGKDIYFMVTFEEGDMHRCLFIGWCFKEDACAEAISSVTEVSSFRTIHFTETYNDVTEEKRIEYGEQFYSFGKNGYAAKFAKLFIDVVGSAFIKAKEFVVNSNLIKLGSASAVSPTVKGDVLNSHLTGVYSDISKGMSDLSLKLTELSVSAAANPTTTHLVSGLTSAAAVASKLSSDMSKNSPNLAKHLNEKILI